MDNGWIKLHRKFLDWEWYDKPGMVQLFVFFLLSANHDNKKWNGFTIKRGQLVTSLESIKAKTGLSIQTIRTCIKRLKSTNEITSKSTSRFTIITICNYASYQQNGNETNKQNNTPNNNQVTNEQQTTNKQLTTNKNEKNDKNDKNKEITPNPLKGERLKNSDKINAFLNLIPSEWHQAVKTWLEYKNKKRQLYKDEKTFLSFFEKIKKESGGEISNFIEAVEQSVKNNWAGVFPKQQVKSAFASHNNQKVYEQF